MNLLKKILIPAAAIALASSASALYLNLDTGGTSAGSSYGNSRTFGPTMGVSATATAWTTTDGTASGFYASYLGQYSGGLGVTNSNNEHHRVDNGGYKDFVLFSFNQSVILDKVVLGSISGDSDLQVWIGNSSTAAGLFVGSSEINNSGISSGSRTADINAGDLVGQYILIGAKLSSSDDAFKIKKLYFDKSSQSQSTPDSGATAALLGLGLLGLAAARKRFVK